MLDGQAYPCNELQMLKFAKNNNIVLLCLHPQTTNNLQPSSYGMTFSLLGRVQPYCPSYKIAPYVKHGCMKIVWFQFWIGCGCYKHSKSL